MWVPCCTTSQDTLFASSSVYTVKCFILFFVMIHVPLTMLILSMDPGKNLSGYFVCCCMTYDRFLFPTFFDFPSKTFIP